MIQAKELGTTDLTMVYIDLLLLLSRAKQCEIGRYQYFLSVLFSYNIAG